MKWSPEFSAERSPTGIFIASLLVDSPYAADLALAEVSTRSEPVDERPIDNTELVRSFTLWAADRYPEGDDPYDRRMTVWRGIYWAYRVAHYFPPGHVASLRASKDILAVDSERYYPQLVTDAQDALCNYASIEAAAEKGRSYIDPDNRYRCMAELAPLVGFMMINNHDAYKLSWYEQHLPGRRRDQEIDLLEAMWAA